MPSENALCLTEHSPRGASPPNAVADHSGHSVVSTPIMFLVACRQLVKYGGGISVALVLGMSLFFASSALWLTTAVLCWKGKWRWMILTFLVALAGAVVGEHVMTALGFN